MKVQRDRAVMGRGRYIVKVGNIIQRNAKQLQKTERRKQNQACKLSVRAFSHHHHHHRFLCPLTRKRRKLVVGSAAFHFSPVFLLSFLLTKLTKLKFLSGSFPQWHINFPSICRFFFFSIKPSLSRQNIQFPPLLFTFKGKAVLTVICWPHTTISNARNPEPEKKHPHFFLPWNSPLESFSFK